MATEGIAKHKDELVVSTGTAHSGKDRRKRVLVFESGKAGVGIQLQLGWFPLVTDNLRCSGKKRNQLPGEKHAAIACRYSFKEFLEIEHKCAKR